MSKEKSKKIQIILDGEDGKAEKYEYNSYEEIPEDIKEKLNTTMNKFFKDTSIGLAERFTEETFKEYIETDNYTAKILEEDTFESRSGKKCLKKSILVSVGDNKANKHIIQIDILLIPIVESEEYDIMVHNVSEMKSLALFELMPLNYKNIRELLNEPKDKLLEKIVKTATDFEK